MIYEPFEKVSGVRTNSDEHHCLQFAFMAALETLGAEPMLVSDAEQATGFKPEGTWPYTMLTWLSSHGYAVKHIESADFQGFVEDPVRELLRQGLDESTVRLFERISDLDAEGIALRRALDDPGVEMIAARPTTARVIEALSSGWLPLLSLDAASLSGVTSADFDGHMVLATGFGDGYLRLQDPGPPTRWDWDVSERLVSKALRTPTENSGTVTLIKPSL